MVDSKGGDWVSGADIFSDESSFYGDEVTREELERRVARYDPVKYWNIAQWNIQCLAASHGQSQPPGIKRGRTSDSDGAKRFVTTVQTKTKQPVATTSMLLPIERNADGGEKPYNPHEGMESARQLSETPSEFLLRLPPSTTPIASAGPWIYVANPFSIYRPTSEDIAGFRSAGSEALNKHFRYRTELEIKHRVKSAASLSRLLKPERERLEQNIFDLAKKFGVISGKWMIFLSARDVDLVWEKIAKAVVDGQLGQAAKVATKDNDPNDRERQICVYTMDFSNIADVGRILKKLRELKIIDNDQQKKPIYYKCDAYTHLDISSGNEYKLKASMYNSKDLFSDMSI